MSKTYSCISCSKTDKIFNMFDTHECEGIEEVYADMLKICFDITVSEKPPLNFMCENCILNLRQAYYFKQQIINNLEALENALASNIEDETSHDFDSQIEMEEGLDPKTGLMTFKVAKQNEADELLVERKKGMKKVRKARQVAENTHFECGDCGKKFPTRGAIVTHVKTHVPGTFPCNHCGKEFSKLNTRNSHQMRVHGSREPYACSKCNLRFPTFHQRLRHLEVEHGRILEYPCPHCDKVYSYAGARSKHVSETHLRVQRHSCSECNMGFFKRRALLNHLASIHNIGEKKHVCPICDKSFFRYPILRNHMKNLHPGEPVVYNKYNAGVKERMQEYRQRIRENADKYKEYLKKDRERQQKKRSGLKNSNFKSSLSTPPSVARMSHLPRSVHVQRSFKKSHKVP